MTELDSFIFTELSNDDYYNGYLDIMYEFSNYKKNVSYVDFQNYIDNEHVKILVIYDNNKRIIGAGTIFKLDKLHNKPVAQIEDVIITEEYRKYGLGKRLIEKLVEIGLENFKCYKVILNCLDKNIGFYEKCDFFIAGQQMRHI
jgi:glucosamine-phosphate N-acetyltransferase